MKPKIDVILSKILLLIIISIVLYWIWNGLNWLWDWYIATSQNGNSGLWEEIWIFIKENISIIAMAYGIISLQVSGLAELKFGNNFIKAFCLALLITPPMMMIVYGGHRKE